MCSVIPSCCSIMPWKSPPTVSVCEDEARARQYRPVAEEDGERERTAASLASISLYSQSLSSGFHRTDFFFFFLTGSPLVVAATPALSA